jgi:hypothetical protein
LLEPDSGDALRSLSEVARLKIEEHLRDKIETNYVDNPKDLLLAAEIATAVNSPHLVNQAFKKMLKFLSGSAVRLREMHSLSNITKAWQILDEFARDSNDLH